MVLQRDRTCFGLIPPGVIHPLTFLVTVLVVGVAFLKFHHVFTVLCVHLLDGARWLLDLGWPNKVSSTGGIYVQKESIANISDTQHAIFEFDELNCVWQHRTWGGPTDPEYPWALKIYGDKGTLAISTYQYDFIPLEGDKKIHREALYEREKFPEDLKEERIELHAAPATRGQMLDFILAIEEKKRP